MPRKSTATKLQQERQVITSLQHSSKTMHAISEDIGLNYYTVRRICEDLQERGVVKVVNYIERARVYAYNASEELHDTIPRWIDSVNQRTQKFIYAVEAVGQENDMAAVQAAKRLPTHVTNIFLAANHAAHGQDVDFRLDKLREAIQRDVLLIKNAASFLEQLLEEPRFWEPEYLAKMTDDPAYNFAVLMKAKDVVDGEEG